MHDEEDDGRGQLGGRGRDQQRADVGQARGTDRGGGAERRGGGREGCSERLEDLGALLVELGAVGLELLDALLPDLAAICSASR